jgi:hypothetical protein
MSTPVLFVKTSCPTVWALLNQRAKANLPNGITEFLSGKWAAEGREQLRLADRTISSLIATTSEKIVGDTYRRDLSGVDTESQLAELLCEITLVEALSSISSDAPVLRPKAEAGKECDVKVVLEGTDLFGESKRLADSWKGGVRSIAKVSRESRRHDANRPRAMDLYDKLKNVHMQFPRNTLNVLFLFHPSVWNTPVYIKQVLFGDAAGFDDSTHPSPYQDGLYALPEWQKISACVHSRVKDDGAFSVVQIWKNPKANVCLADSLDKKFQSMANHSIDLAVRKSRARRSP